MVPTIGISQGRGSVPISRPIDCAIRAQGMILMQQMERSLTDDGATANASAKGGHLRSQVIADRAKSSVEPSCKSRRTSNVEAEEEPFTFTLCTYNLWKSKGKPACWDVRRDVLLRHLRQLDPDVLLVQELCPEISTCVLEALQATLL